MQHDLGDRGGEPHSLSHLPGNPIVPNQQYPAEGAAAVSEAAGLWPEAVAAATAAAAAAAACSPATLNANGRAHQLTAGDSDSPSGPTGALDLLASLANEK